MVKKDKDPAKLPYRPCVGIIVLNKENKVWAGHRSVATSRELSLTEKRWQLPQGGIDKGEEPLAAAKRELWEETGIVSADFLSESATSIKYDLPEELIGKALKGKYRGQEMYWFAFRFTGSEDEINISNPPDGAPVEFDAWKWLDMHDLPNLIVPFKKKLYTQVVAEFEHLVL